MKKKHSIDLVVYHQIFIEDLSSFTHMSVSELLSSFFCQVIDNFPDSMEVGGKVWKKPSIL